MTEYKKYLDEAVKIAKTAGKTIKEAFENRQFISEHLEIKENNSSDLVTATDQYVEKMVKSHLNKVFPTHSFIGEETTAANNMARCELTDNPTWCIDPIDGTTNFVHGLPFTCISIGLLINKEPVMGVIFNPILNDLYTATKNGGAFLNGKPLPLIRPIQPLETLEKSLIITEYGANRNEESVKAKLDTIHQIIKYPVHGIRSFGSAAMNMCYVARGSCDIYYEIGIHAWDVAAATCILKEAGGVVVGWKPYKEVSEPEKKKQKTESSKTEKIDIVNEKFDVLNRHVLCIRQLAEGPEKQNEILAEVRKRLIDCEIERD
ncbi:IMPase 1 [Anaeromyces robustus]|uniref:Inositol-1-monophosphatase n=1 Tax=Anaeromyces robustus TaxID=1754192 RepID=A0A1Y1XQJ6_9FUNG|nr:IMPase 1 [Anaeromyces robustus]|eukprot:ORX88008.1 IMPase 1 [Anaeromyces robustus]